MKKAIALAMTAVMAATTLAACGSSASSDAASASTSGSAATSEAADPSKPYAGVTLHYAATDTEATYKCTTALLPVPTQTDTQAQT